MSIPEFTFLLLISAPLLWLFAAICLVIGFGYSKLEKHLKRIIFANQR